MFQIQVDNHRIFFSIESQPSLKYLNADCAVIFYFIYLTVNIT
jgi:hypothetical protein